MGKPKFNHPRAWFKGRNPATWEGEVFIFAFIIAVWLMAYFGVGS